MNRSNFFRPKYHYYGKNNPENISFNTYLQEFSQKISYISSLETNGKLSSDEAYRQLKHLWKQLKEAKKQFLTT